MRAMYRKDSRPELENKIERYKALARQVPNDETAQNIRSLVAEQVAPDRRAIPHVGDKIEVEGWRLEIVDMDWAAN
jgi:CBS domain containing-hemolysin-like protein